MFVFETMSVFTFETTLALTEARHADLLKESEIRRSLEQARSAEPRLQDHILISTGNFLVSVGQKLQGRLRSQGIA